MATEAVGSFGLFIGGREISSSRGEQRTLLNPATNRPLATVAVGGPEDARHALEEAEKALGTSGWSSDDGSRRARTLSKLAQLLEAQADEFAQLETFNMGKTLKESRGDIGYTVRTLEYVSGLADKIEGETIPVPGNRFDYTLREPLGVTVHLAPWNYPLLLSIRSVAPALAAGNAVVLKPATLTPLTALKFAQLAQKAGLPDGIFNVVLGSGGDVGETLITDPRCRSVSFTGSLEVGLRIAELAARRVLPVTLELGGKSPVLVLPDADLERAAKGIAFGIFGNAGQMCWAGSRLLAARSIHDELVGKVAAIARSLRLGPGWEKDVDMGPLVSREHRERVLGFVTEARDAGADVVTGGSAARAERLAAGNFTEPTLLTNVDPQARVFREEVFGPVLSVVGYDGIEEGVRLANQSRYGLFAAIWTKDLSTAHTLARLLEAGMVSINEAPNTFPQTPFGGHKESGIGFEQGRKVLELFTRAKNVLIHLGATKKSG
jgi:acyl-CoA reductase-like NAD-dependent aldehyde dehydrogenase